MANSVRPTFIKSFLEATFPIAAYKAKKVANGLCLHYLIVLNQPEAAIQKWIENRKSKKPEHLDYQDPAYYKLTPLAVCALTGNAAIAHALIDAGAKLSRVDFKGWTPLHHAVVLRCDLLKELFLSVLGADAAANLKSFHGGSYRDLEALLSAEPADGATEVCWIREAQAVTKCTASRFKEITGADFCKTIVMSPEQLMGWWKSRDDIYLPGSLAYTIQRDYLKKVQPSLLLEYEKVQAAPIQLTLYQGLKGGYSVETQQPIEPFQGIVVYGGRLICDQAEALEERGIEATDYIQNEIDGTRVRNLGPMINDSFPNCMVVTVRANGYEYQLIVANRKIAAGETLYLDYSSGHNVKTRYLHHELNLEGLLAFLKNDGEELTRWVSKPWSEDELISLIVDLEQQAKLSSLRYLINTPSTLLQLIGIDRFPLELIRMTYNKREELALDKESSILAYYCGVIAYSLKTKAVELGSALKEMRQACFSWSQDYPAQTVINILPSLAEIKTQDQWEEFKKDLPAFLALSQAIGEYELVNDNAHFQKIKENLPLLSASKKALAIKIIETYTQSFSSDDPRAVKLFTLL